MTDPKIYGVVGWKNSGKTGLMERLVAEFTARGLVVSTLKHTHHQVDLEVPGTDTHRHREAGAQEVVLASTSRIAQLHELRGEPEPDIATLISRLHPCDLVLIEGFKSAPHPKIEASRAETGQPLFATDDATVRVVAANHTPSNVSISVIDLDDTKAVADFIARDVGLMPDAAESAPMPAPQAGLKKRLFCPAPRRALDPGGGSAGDIAGSFGPGDETRNHTHGHGPWPHFGARSHGGTLQPAGANSAVDGYAFAHATLPSGTPISLPLVDGRAAAGGPFQGRVPAGHAIRILTGALIPDGVDTVVLQEDVQVADGMLTFPAAPKPGSNARAAGEDVAAGQLALPLGHKLRAPDIALLSALGVAEVAAHTRLRVGVLSTGDELAAPGSTMDVARTYDANRPMLLSLAETWGYEPVDLGHVADDRAALAAAFDKGSERADVILTSGGASAGDEDHVSALLKDSGSLHHWRIAIKPGRPLALAQWNGTPVFGLPGNPVAALVTTLIFARPAFSVLAGGDWVEPLGMQLPAGFSKKKKAGRREYLRARIGADGRVEAFKSEGSGRISGLSWATGLVELPDVAQEITPGDPVRFLPYAGFGLV